MILKASQRGGAARLAAHLLNAQDNDHVEVYEVSGFIADNLPDAVFEDAAQRIEQTMGLEGQPRVIAFHEKEGRRHAHAVWSRIDAKTMTAVNLPYFKKNWWR